MYIALSTTSSTFSCLSHDDHGLQLRISYPFWALIAEASLLGPLWLSCMRQLLRHKSWINVIVAWWPAKEVGDLGVLMMGDLKRRD
jgi:hypothetical protein